MAWFEEMRKALPARALNLGAVTGPEVQPSLVNLVRNLREGRVRVMQIIVRKDGARRI